MFRNFLSPSVVSSVARRHFSADAGRGFTVLGIQQIAVGGTSKDRLSKLWVDTLGLDFQSTFKSEKENVDEDILACGCGPFKVEVDSESFWKCRHRPADSR